MAKKKHVNQVESRITDTPDYSDDDESLRLLVESEYQLWAHSVCCMRLAPSAVSYVTLFLVEVKSHA